MSDNHETPSSLLTQCKKNLPEGWERMKVLYGRLILYWCKNAGLQENDRYDVYQDVMLTLVKNIHQFRKERPGDKFRKWLKTITHSRISDFFRKQQQQPILKDMAEFSEREAIRNTREAEEVEILFQQLFQLLKSHFDAKTLEAFRLMNRPGSTSEEVGKELGMTAVAVRAAKKRVMDRIRKDYGDLL
ncbi:MAG: sigma-70 family RNA polymerase sigma factor [Planctomycetia bacterium]|nr:sigma-70 family RNA polymerase sigma factor [Planctomycetia bacterium]